MKRKKKWRPSLGHREAITKCDPSGADDAVLYRHGYRTWEPSGKSGAGRLTLSVSTALQILSHDLSWTICRNLWMDDLNQLWNPVKANIFASLRRRTTNKKRQATKAWLMACMNKSNGTLAKRKVCELRLWPTWEEETPGSPWGSSGTWKAQRRSRPSSALVWNFPAPGCRKASPWPRWHHRPPVKK